MNIENTEVDTGFKDFLRRPLAIDDYVVFPSPRGGGMKLGKIIRFSAKQIRVQWTFKNYAGGIGTTDASRYSCECVKVDGPDLVMYLLSGDF